MSKSNGKYTEHVKTFLTEEQKLRLEGEAAKRGLSVAAYLRSLILWVWETRA